MASEHHGAFGQDRFGRGAEKVARFLGTPQYIVGQTIVVLAWIAVNAVAVASQWDPYPFILLNLAFSTQAAYAAPLILLAGNRQSVRDRLTLEHAAAQSDVEEKQNEQLIRDDKEILEHVVALEKQILELEQRILNEMRGPGQTPTG